MHFLNGSPSSWVTPLTLLLTQNGWPPDDSANPKFKWFVGISSVRTHVLDSQSGRRWAWRPQQFSLGIKRNQGRKKSCNILLGAAFINSNVCPSHPATQASLPLVRLVICKADTNSSLGKAFRRIKWNSGHLQGAQPVRASLWLLLWGDWDGTKQKCLGRRLGQNEGCSCFVVVVLPCVFSKLVPFCEVPGRLFPPSCRLSLLCESPAPQHLISQLSLFICGSCHTVKQAIPELICIQADRNRQSYHIVKPRSWEGEDG